MLAASAQEPLWAQPPIEYGVRPSRDRVARLAEQLASGERVLDTDNGGFLPGLLRALEVSVNSQTTVFSPSIFAIDEIRGSWPGPARRGFGFGHQNGSVWA